MDHHADNVRHGHPDESMSVDYVRFALDARAALPASAAWADRVQLGGDIGSLLVEARGSRRPEVLGVLVRCVRQTLHRSDPAIAATVGMRDMEGAVVPKPTVGGPPRALISARRSAPASTGFSDLVVAGRSVPWSEESDMVGDPRPVDAAGLADRWGSDANLSDYLRLISEASTELLDVAALGCTLADPRGELQVAMCTSDQVLDLERLGLQERQGPSVDCYATGQPVVNIGRIETRRRWPSISTELLEAGLGSMHALPLRVGGPYRRRAQPVLCAASGARERRTQRVPDADPGGGHPADAGR